LETVKRLYEAMFLVDSGQAASEWDGVIGLIENILKKADAEVVCLRKWSDRKLAYDIEHKGRGTYILCYFKVDGRKIAGIERDIRLSERIMRSLILTAEERPSDHVERDISGQFQVPDDIHLGDTEEPERTRMVRPMAEVAVEPEQADAGAGGRAGEAEEEGGSAA
jgi:small subunit ribosomal protein S6